MKFCYSRLKYLFVAVSINFLFSGSAGLAVGINQELVVNGNFDSGKFGFTSEYSYQSDKICNAGDYTVTNDLWSVRINGDARCKPFARCGDHTTGSGNMLVADGSKVQAIWKQTINNIDKEGVYKFEFFATYVSDSGDRAPSFQVQINGRDLEVVYLTPDQCHWQKFVVMWESGQATTANLSIITAKNEVYWNDFALDDVSFKLYCALKTSHSADTSICFGSVAQLSTTTLDGLPPFTYEWKDNFGNSYPANVNNISVSPSQTTQYTVRTLDSNMCESVEDITVTVLPLPAINIQSDKPLKLCDRETLTLTASGGESYLWSTGETTPSIEVTQNGTYAVTVTNENGCISSDSAVAEFVPLPVAAIATDKPTDICPCSTIKLTANEGYTYLWSTGETTQTIETGLPGDYSVTIADAMGCSATAQISVSVKSASESIRIDSSTARVGDTIAFPIRQVAETNMKDCGFSRFVARLRFNKSLLIPLGGNYSSTFEGGDQILEITGNTLEEVLSEVRFLAVLGDAVCTDLVVERFERDCADISTEVINGQLCLVGICTDPTARLFRDTGILDMTVPVPNPASAYVELGVSLIEPGSTELVIINAFGEEVAQVFAREMAAGQYPVRFDCSGLAQGTYFCVLRTPTASITRRLEVVK